MMGEAADDGNSDDAQTLAWSRPERSEPVRRTGLGGRDWSAMLKRVRKVVQNKFKRSLVQEWVRRHPDDCGDDGTISAEGWQRCTENAYGNAVKIWWERTEELAFRDIYAIALSCLAVPATECASEGLFMRMKRLATSDGCRACPLRNRR